jgi:hypothetical protein
MLDKVVACRLRCSISGGLEELAEEEMKKLGLANVKWTKRGQHGSRLEIQVQGSSDGDLVAIIGQLHYVEYMYLEILKAQVSFESKEALLRQVKHHTAGTSIHVEKSLVLWREARGFLRDRRDVGLETIPGILLPTPTIIPEGILTTSEGEPTNTASDGEFVVNTVYTKPPEAKAVVGVYLQLVKQYSKE